MTKMYNYAVIVTTHIDNDITIRDMRVIHAYNSYTSMNAQEFIEHLYAEREEDIRAGLDAYSQYKTVQFYIRPLD